MKRGRSRDRLRDMLEAAEEAAFITAGKSRDAFMRDRILVLAIVRLVEVLGEAAKHVPAETKRSLPAIPWSRIAGMRDRLAHAYFDVDMDVLWSVVDEELAPLVATLRPVVGQT